jgi:hypothetical protein
MQRTVGSSTKTLKTVAKVSLVVLLLSVLGQFIIFYQTKYQLTSPLVPQNTIWMIVKPNIFIGFISTIVSIIALLLYFFDKYILVIILVGLALIWQQLYPVWAV